MDYLISILLIGAGATAAMDLWGMARTRLLAVPALDYAFLGRWLGHMLRGRFRHERIAASAPVRGERLVGWTAHYAVGIAFAALLIAAWGLDWARSPTLAPALIVGIGSVAAPLLVMQPAMGARRTPLRSVATHAVFGLGLYAAAWLNRFILGD
jgi:hypothetical protein